MLNFTHVFYCINFRHWQPPRKGSCSILIATLLIQFAVPGTTTLAAEPVESEKWFLIEFDNHPVGFEHVKTRRTADATQPLLACYRKTELYLNRMGQNLTLRASLWTTQSPDGQLKSFSLQRVDGAGTRIERSGRLSATEDAFVVKELVAATRREFRVPVPSGTRSPIVSVWLPQSSTILNNRLNLPVFFPETAGVATVTVEKKQDQEIRLNNKPFRAKRIEFYPDADPGRSTTLFLDDQLSVVRQEKTFLSRLLSMQETSADVALSASTNKTLDLDVQSLIPIDHLISGNGNYVARVLELRVNSGFLPNIPDATFQSTESIDGSSTRLTLLPPKLPDRTNPSNAAAVHSALATTRWLPVSDPALQSMALFNAGSERDPGAICRRLEAAVHAKLRRSAFSTALLPANEVAKTLKGDCTEHAVLLATLMRIKGIPARVATGLVHTNQQYGFVGHAWVEALIGGQWIPFDSAVGQSGVTATYIKLTDSEMPDTLTSGVSLFLPVLELAGRASIHVVSD
jgi:hypothetical protein